MLLCLTENTGKKALTQQLQTYVNLYMNIYTLYNQVPAWDICHGEAEDKENAMWSQPFVIVIHEPLLFPSMIDSVCEYLKKEWLGL